MASLDLLRSEKPWRVGPGTKTGGIMPRVTGFENGGLVLAPGMEKHTGRRGKDGGGLSLGSGGREAGTGASGVSSSGRMEVQPTPWQGEP